ncbi:hypothetical protein [[Limnothrix rosea] IAM M-220]|nr:hypothetical protein [[Limnothrix rosea] IAM M-220]
MVVLTIWVSIVNTNMISSYGNFILLDLLKNIGDRLTELWR